MVATEELSERYTLKQDSVRLLYVILCVPCCIVSLVSARFGLVAQPMAWRREADMRLFGFESEGELTMEYAYSDTPQKRTNTLVSLAVRMADPLWPHPSGAREGGPAWHVLVLI
jgi:hypothetical protein